MKETIKSEVKLLTDRVNSICVCVFTIAGPQVWVPQAAVFAQAAHDDGDAGEEEHQAYDNTGHHQRGHQQRSLGPRLPLAAAIWVLPMALVGAHCRGVRGQGQRSSLSRKRQLWTAVRLLATAPPSGHIMQPRPCPIAHPASGCASVSHTHTHTRSVVGVIRLWSQYVSRLIRLLTCHPSLPVCQSLFLSSCHCLSLLFNLCFLLAPPLLPVICA